MESVVTLFGKDIIVGVSQILYDIVLTEIGNTATNETNQSYGSISDQLIEDFDIDINEYQVVRLKGNKMVARRFNLVKDDEIYVKQKRGDIASDNVYFINITIKLIGREDDKYGGPLGEALGLGLIINYGSKKLEELIMDHINVLFDGLVNDQYIFINQKVKMHIDVSKEDIAIPIVFEMTFKVIDEKIARPEGEIYKKTQMITKVGKK